MEFLRFGSTIPGSYWGCCACCIIQNFNTDPDAAASIQMVSGDGGGAIGDNFAGPTFRDIFWKRLRVGTFSTNEMPDHAFLAILTSQQIASQFGKAWLAILKEAGFEFIRTVDNSVYTGANILKGEPSGSSHPNYIFGLFRNIGTGAIVDPFTPPKAWTDLPSVVPEAVDFIASFGDDVKDFVTEQREAQIKVWQSMPNPSFMTRKQLEDQKVPVTLAGIRSENKQELASIREARQGVSKTQSLKVAPISPVALTDVPVAVEDSIIACCKTYPV